MEVGFESLGIGVVGPVVMIELAGEGHLVMAIGRGGGKVVPGSQGLVVRLVGLGVVEVRSVVEVDQPVKDPTGLAVEEVDGEGDTDVQGVADELVGLGGDSVAGLRR